MISLAVIAPVVEEVVFRGFIYGGLRTRLRGGSLGGRQRRTLRSAPPSRWKSLPAPRCSWREWRWRWCTSEPARWFQGMVLHASFNLIAVVAIFVVGTHAACHWLNSCRQIKTRSPAKSLRCAAHPAHEPSACRSDPTVARAILPQARDLRVPARRELGQLMPVTKALPVRLCWPSPAW